MTKKIFPDDDGLYFIPLGGSNEIGMNLNIYRYKGRLLIVDMGIGFADDYLPGVDVIVPDISFLQANKKNIAALVLTHAHEDHMGAVPYLWQGLNCPIYATAFTANALKAKLLDMGSQFRVPIQVVEPRSRFNIEPFQLEMVPLTHSIPEMNAIAIHTEKGTVLHTGDWKFDNAPVVGETSDFKALEALGDNGVLAMVCDSTNAFVVGESGSEQAVQDELVKLIASCKERIVITTFASNIARLQSIIRAARENNREIAIAGRSMHRMISSARECGYIDSGENFLSEEHAMKLPRHQVLIMTTGSQGEMRAGIWRIAAGDHPTIKLKSGDAVIFSSREIPGNEKRIGIAQNRLIQSGIKVITSRDFDIHVSGHPARDELSRMYGMVRPKISVPVHGEQRHMAAHAELALSLQVPKAILGHNGAIIRLDGDDTGIIGEVTSGYMAIDGNSLLPSDGSVMRMRRRIKDDGVVFVSVFIERDASSAEVMVSAPGLLDAVDDKEWLEEISAEIARSIDTKISRRGGGGLEDAIRVTVRRIFSKEFAKKPIVQVHLFRL